MSRSFFDSVDHEWLMRMLAHRIADRRILRLIRMWLEAGILESGEWCETDRGTPQGAGISPLLANVFLHYVLDLWVQQWRRRRARGRVVIVRYADDFVMGFEKTDDARRMMAALTERLAKFGLAIHDEKTRLIEFGRLPALARRQRGLRRPETFAFLGFTHYCGWTRDGRFIVKLKTQSKRLTRKLKALRQEAWRLMHVPLAVQHRWYHQRSARSLRLLWPTTKLPGAHRVPSGSAPHLADLPATAQSENAAHELADLCGSADKLSPSNPSDHSSLDGSCSMTQVILGKSRVREICMPGSVRAKAKWLSYSTIPFVSSHCNSAQSPSGFGETNELFFRPQVGSLLAFILASVRIRASIGRSPSETCQLSYPSAGRGGRYSFLGECS